MTQFIAIPATLFSDTFKRPQNLNATQERGNTQVSLLGIAKAYNRE
jgi:hypothetical protein